MRDIVSKHGTIRVDERSGTMPKKATKSTVHGSDVNTANYNGVMFYIIPILYSDGLHTFVIEEADDNGSGSAGSYSTVANADLVLWKATSTTDFTPVKVGGSQPVAFDASTTFLYQRVGYIGGKQWVRCSVTNDDSTAAGGSISVGASYEVVIELGEPRNMPAAL